MHALPHCAPGKKDCEVKVESKPTVLCIEEDPTLLDTRALVLEAAGFAVLRARDARLGLELFVSRQIHAVVLPHQLLNMDAARVATAMKHAKPAVPIVVIAAELLSEADTDASVDAVVCKGHSPLELLGALDSVLGIRSLAKTA
jgi:DNA-binding response OmpR family regulator